MPATLKSIELQGYKTFASQTLFEFAGSVTAIVGPNGSGKSNIADSLRWVLGEQSYSLLRGKKTADMIFAGSESRPRAGMASASVIFDNEEGWLPIDFSEVSITRRAYRDGTNEYLINGQRVRLKDVNELLAQSGLAERTYTIIGQGVVDAALALRPQDRRRLFEEAAGIGLYRSRREEALRRLDTTQRNLDRVQDILAELRPRLRSLERQARRSAEYQQLRKDLKVLLREWYGYHWHNAQTDLAESRHTVEVQGVLLAGAHEAHNEFDTSLSQVRSEINGLRARLSSWHRQLADLHRQREEISRQQAVADERTRALTVQRASLDSEILQLQQKLAIQETRLLALQEQAAARSHALEEYQTELVSAQSALQARQDEQQTAQEAIAAAREHLVNLNSRHTQLLVHQEQHQEQRLRLEEELVTNQAAVSQTQGNITALQGELQHAEETLAVLRSAVQEAQHKLEEHRTQHSALETSRGALNDTYRQQTADVSRMQAELQVLDQAEASFSGYASGTQALLRAAQQSQLKGAQGALSSFLEVSAEYERPIAAALGDYLDAVLLDRHSSTEFALDHLDEQALRGSLLPLDSLAPPEPIRLSAEDRELLGADLIGQAATLVQAPANLTPVIDLLLGDTLVVRTRRAAKLIIHRFNAASKPPIRVVTLQGEVYHSTGAVQARGPAAGAGSTLSRPRHRKELAAQLTKSERSLAELGVQIESNTSQLTESHEAIDQLLVELREQRSEESAAIETVNRLQTQIAGAENQHDWLSDQTDQLQQQLTDRLTAEAAGEQSLTEIAGELLAARESVEQGEGQLRVISLQEYQTDVAHWTTQVALAQQSANSAAARVEEIQLSVQTAQRALSEAQQRQVDLEAELAALEADLGIQRTNVSDLHQQIEELTQQIEPAEADLALAETELDQHLNREAGSRQTLSKAENSHAQARIDMAREQEALENWRRRIEDDFGLVAFEYDNEVSGPTPLPLDGLVEQLPRVEVLNPEVEQGVRSKRAQIRRVGAVNPEAQTEYEQVKERHAFLQAQVEDLREAEVDVRQVISELDELMQIELRKTFDAVADEFSDIFTRLFGGGAAKLMLTDPDDMTNTGIDIEARLPGRRIQGLSLLSGGERSLTATALVFALLKFSPTPFCVLDEVDAMLDEANVGRFREQLLEISANTQVIIVTHNRNTVQVADVIYGITMGRDSSSQVISLKLDEVSKIV